MAKIDSGEPLEENSDDEECEVISITSIGSAEVTDLSSSPSPPPTAADVQVTFIIVDFNCSLLYY